MSKKGSPPKTVNMMPPSGLFGLQQRGDDNSESLDESSQHATRRDGQVGKHTNHYHPPQGYGYPPSQQLFPDAAQFNHQSPFDMRHSSQPASRASQGYPPCYAPPWEGYDLHEGDYRGSKMFPSLQFPEQGPSSPGALRVPAGLPGNHPVN